MRKSDPRAVAALLAILATASCLSCAGKSDALVILDPALGTISPSTARAMISAAASSLTLPEQEARSALYSAIDKREPRAIILSPLLQAEISPLLEAYPGLEIGCAGDIRETEPNPRLWLTGFDTLEAFETAARALKSILAAVPARDGESPSAFAIVDRATSSGTPWKRFLSTFDETGEPFILTTRVVDDIAQADSAMKESRGTGVKAVFLAAGPRNGSALSTDFPGNIPILAVFELDVPGIDAYCHAFAVPDMGKALRALGASMRKSPPGESIPRVPLAWAVSSAGKKLKFGSKSLEDILSAARRPGVSKKE